MILAHASVLRQLEQALQQIEDVRKAVQGKPEAKRWEAIISSPVNTNLLAPVAEALNREGAVPRDADTLLDFLRETIGYLTEENLTAICVGTPTSAR